MAEVRRVTGPGTPLGGRDGRILGVVVVGILVAIIKPWGGGPSAAPLATPIVLPSASVAASPSASAAPDDPFDFGVFEGFEPNPAWEVWPAGREISFGFAMRINADGSQRSPAPGSSAAPDDPLDPGPPPEWSQAIAISPASTLTVVAINLPLAYRIPTMHLFRTDGGEAPVEVPIVMVPSPWPDHFLVVGMAGDDGRAREAWPAGEYELRLDIEPGDYTRTITIDVAAMPTATPTPTGSTAPSPSGDPASTAPGETGP